MKRKALALTLAVIMAAMIIPAASFGALAADPQYNGETWYSEIGVTQIGREYPHSSYVTYQNDPALALANEKSVFTKDPARSDYYQLLSSETEWKFFFARSLSERLVRGDDRSKLTYGSEVGWNTAGWDTIPVPSNWQQIRGENLSFKYEPPVYQNHHYPWYGTETENISQYTTAPTTNNTVGHYQRTFTLDEGWENRNTFICFDAVDSCFYLWVDGNFVGYAEDSFTASHFNLTPYLDPALDEHVLSVQVYKWSTGSYLENQDTIHHSGIFHDVYLYSKDSLELRDYFITTDLDDNYVNATLNLEANVRNLGQNNPAPATVEATLYDAQDRPVWDAPLVIAADLSGKAVGEEIVVSGSKLVEAPALWFADTPNLYRLLIQVKQGGVVRETIVQRFGFREIGKKTILKNGITKESMIINGKKIMLRGVNRSETDPYKGRAIGPDEITKDLQLMKSHNVNALRMSHYPNHPYTYALADEWGIYVCDEANVESHYAATSSGIPSRWANWIPPVMDRMQNMVERDKNHSSVVIWSLGNEATYNNDASQALNENVYSMYAASAWTVRRDPTRLRKYERDNRFYRTQPRVNSIVDITSRQYPSPSGTSSEVNGTSTVSPYIWSEYAHAMGNGLGHFDEYWAIARANENHNGGFVWDWIDQTVMMEVVNTYAYQFADPQYTNETVSINGTVEEGMNGSKAVNGHYFHNAPSPTARSSAVTLEAWVKPERNANAHNTIISKGDSGYTLKLDKRSGHVLEFFMNGYSPGTVTYNMPDEFYDGEWKHIVGVAQANRLYLYYNGALVGQGNTGAAPYDTQTGRGITVGNAPDYTDRRFVGLINSVGVYNVGLTAEQVTDAWNAKTLFAAAAENIVYKADFSDSDIIVSSTNYPEGEYYGFGGDFSPSNDNDFCANGIINANREVSAELIQMKKTHQEISFYSDNADDGAKDGRIRIVNEFLNTNLDQYTISWKLTEDSKTLQSGTLENFALAPLGETTVQLPLEQVDAKPGSDYLLVLTATMKGTAPWTAGANHEAAFQEFTLDYETALLPGLNFSAMSALQSTETDSAYVVTGTNFEVAISKSTGYITSYKVGGKDILTSGPKPNFYKAPISNDDTGNNPTRWNAFRNMADGLVIDTAQTTADVREKVAMFDFVGTLPAALNGATETLRYIITGDGQIVVDNTVIPNGSLGSLPRIGMRMMVADGYDKVEYYGRGPWENYIDRKSGSKIGVYSGTVEEMDETNYVRPQNFANRTDVKWTSLTDAQGDGIMISSLDAFETSATHYIEEDMYQKRHWWQVPKQTDTVLSVDMRIRGLGNASCAGSEALGEHQVNGTATWRQTFRISPISSATDKMAESKLNPVSMLPVQNILIDGVPLEGFTQGRSGYEVLLPPNSVRQPAVVSAVLADPAAEVSIEQIEYYPGTAKVTATSPSGFTSVYTIDFKIIAEDFIYAETLPSGGTAASRNDWSNSHLVGWGILGICQCGANDHADLSIRLSKNGTSSTADGNMMRFDHGLGIHADGWVTYDTSAYDFDKFTSWIGINYCQTSATANVIFRVQVMYEDGSTEEIFTSRPKRAATNGTVANGGLPEYIEVDIPENVKAIRLHSDANGSNGNDHSVWADAKFTFDTPTWDNIADYLAIPLEKGQQQGNMPKAPVGWEFELIESSDANVMNEELYIPELAYSQREVQMKFRVTERKAEPQKTEEVTVTVTIPKIDADKEALSELIDRANVINQGDYTSVSYAALTAALDAAQVVYDDDTATQAEVDSSAQALSEALDALVVQEVVFVEESDEHLTFSGGWSQRAQIGKFSGHIAMQASKLGESMSFKFKGSYFEILSYKSYSQGMFDIYVDG
ncbi:MAG TPA: hypothetical protein DEQ02_01525, partial [Ruminococcaceae bacterium]|nr:hypothetical protein [Oscillospiraceae bacterium]